MNKCLVIIPARGGSKGIPDKNIKKLNGKPLIFYSIDIAKMLFQNEDICVSTDSNKIIDLVEQYGLKTPFIRPKELATDNAGTYEVLLHAINHYENKGMLYDTILLLQPTSPFRRIEHIRQALEVYKHGDAEMVVSVKESKANPYYNLFEENSKGFLEQSKPSTYTRRQDCPPVFEYNGAVYVINVPAIKKKKITQFSNVKKIVMDDISSLDLDTPLDWNYCEFILQNNLLE